MDNLGGMKPNLCRCGRGLLLLLLAVLSVVYVCLTSRRPSRPPPRLLQQLLLQQLWAAAEDIGQTEARLPHYAPWPTTTRGLHIVQKHNRYYFTEVAAIPNCRTVYLTVTKAVFRQLLAPSVYAAHSNACYTMLTIAEGMVNNDIFPLNCTEKLDEFQYTYTTDITEKYDFHTGIFGTNRIFETIPALRHDHIGVGFIHILRNVYITSIGNVITNTTYLKIKQCRNYKNTLKNYETIIDNVPKYDRVFSITQAWSKDYFHVVIEVVPRLVLALPYLWQHEDIKVHVHTLNTFTISFLQELGIPEQRLVTGNISSRVAYVPGGTPCLQAAVLPVSALSTLLQAQLQQQYQQDTLVLIRRSAKRWFSNHDAILAMLRGVGAAVGVRVEVFGDAPPPGLHATRVLFNRALLVVAPHGAGLSNLVFSQPGTCVIEALCKPLYLCFKHLAQTLGHVYYGFIQGVNCKQTTATQLKPHIMHCLRWKLSQR